MRFGGVTPKRAATLLSESMAVPAVIGTCRRGFGGSLVAVSMRRSGADYGSATLSKLDEPPGTLILGGL